MTTTPLVPVPAKQIATPGATLAVKGAATDLEAAFQADQPVTLHSSAAEWPFEGERVYLGHLVQSWGDDAATVTRVGHDRTVGHSPRFDCEISVYLVDTTRLDEAPNLAAEWRKRTNASMIASMEAIRAAEAESDASARSEDD